MTDSWNDRSIPQDQSTTQQAKDQAGRVADTARTQAQDVKDSAQVQAGEVKDHALGQAQDVKDQAVVAGHQVADTAKVEASQVVDEARDQIQGLLDTARGELGNRARDGHTALAGSVSGLSDELSRISRGETTTGPVNQLVNELATRGESLSSWLQTHEPEDVLVEARRFAARRPVAFLALAAGAGMLAGRLARGTRELAKDEQQPRPLTQRPVQQAEYGTGYRTTQPAAGLQSGTGYQSTSYQTTSYQTSGYQAQQYPTQGTGYPTDNYRPLGDQGDYPTGGLQERGDRAEQFGGHVTEGYVHTTRTDGLDDTQGLGGTEGGLR